MWNKTWFIVSMAFAVASSAARGTSHPAPASTTAAGPVSPLAAAQRAVPEQLRTNAVRSRRGMVVTGNVASSRAAAKMLATGGNAIDAAVAAAFALGVAEPGSGGLGGQTYILVRLADGRAVAIDGSARAPLRCSPEELDGLRETTTLIRPGTYFWGHKSAATPGTLAALDLALRVLGTKSLAEVVAPSIEIAEFGSAWSAALRSFLVDYPTKVRASAYLGSLYLRDSVDIWDTDHVYCNPDIACFLRRLVAAGAGDFYRGAIAAEIERDMIENGGWLRRADLSLLDAVVRAPVRGRFRGLEVLSFPFPGGGSAVVEALGILDRFEPRLLRESSADRVHLLVESCRLALADSFPVRRPTRLPDFQAADAGHIARRAAQIRFDRALLDGEVNPGPLSRLDVGGTVQVSVADAFGNVVSLTQTLGGTFGAGVTPEGFGFPFNNLLNGFDFSDPLAWAYLRPLQPPMTSMAPTIVVMDGAPLLILGSAGSMRIAPAIVGTIVGVVDVGLPLDLAIAAPRALWGGGSDPQVYLEVTDATDESLAEELARRGFAAQERLAFPATPYAVTDFGGVNAIFVGPADGTMIGVGDPRRQGVALAPGGSAEDEPPPALLECWRDLLAATAGAPMPKRPLPPSSAPTLP